MFAAAEKELLDLAFQLRERAVLGALARIEDDRPLRVQVVQAQADGFPQASLDAVADNGAPNGARDGKTDAGAGIFGIGKAESRKQRAGIAGAVVVNSSEIARS